MRYRVPWFLVGVSAICSVLDTLILAAHGPLLSGQVFHDHGWPMVNLATLGSATMGALIVSRQPKHPIGWLLVVAGTSSIAVTAESYSFWPPGGSSHAAVTAGHVIGWVGALFGSPVAITAVILIFLIAPGRRLASVITRCVALSAMIGGGCYILGVLSLAPTSYNVDDLGPSSNVFTSVAVYLTTISLLASVLILLVRLSRAQGAIRQQLLWITVPAAVLAGTFTWLLVTTQFDFSGQSEVAAVFLYVGYVSVPLCTAIAVLHHRLLDIDVIVSRALLIVFATTLITALYVLIVVSLGSIVPGDGIWPALPAMAAAAVAFQPLRQRVVRFADHLAYGAAAEPYDALADFSRRLGDSPDPSDLLSAMADAAANAVRARRVTVALGLPFAGTETATWPPGTGAGRGPTSDIAVADARDRLGFLTVEMPPGRALRSADIRLLHDLADQAVVAFRNARLSAELAHRVGELDQQARALEESRRRLITAADAERSRLEQAITRDVAPHLRTLPDRLDHVARGDGTVTAEVVQPMRAEAELSLEALREITRGVYPAQLSRAGLESALRSLLARTADAHLTIDSVGETGTVDAGVETAAYFCVAEALRDLRGPVEVSLVVRDEVLRLLVDGRNDRDLPLANMRDRTEAVGGTVRTSRAKGTLSLEVHLPRPRRSASIEPVTQ